MGMLKRSVIVSGLLHVAVIAAATVAWPHALNLPDESPPVVPVDLVTIADVTNIAPSVKEAEKPPTPPEEQAPPQPEAAAPPPPKAEVAPPDPDKVPLPKPKEPPKEAEQNASTAPVNPARPRRKPTPDAQQKFDVDSVLALLDKRAPKAAAPPANAKPAEDTVKGLGAQDALTMDLKDALLAQMRECWNVPVGAPNPEQLIVQVRVFLAQDGSLAQPPQLEPASRAAAAASPYMRTAAEAALRAVNVCEPYKRLPREKYDAWREIVMTFDPSKMIGR
jgi:colicin import membrane protein